MDKVPKLHIISFDVPAPPDYGGVIDVFYKIKALSEAGVQIILHCYTYGRPKNQELEKYCSKVFYYKRAKGLRYLFSRLPYIVMTRSSAELLKNLTSLQAPILFEGLHTCYFINHPKLAGFLKIIRMHNVEQDYYRYLANDEKNLLKKWFYNLESKKLKHYEAIINSADCVLTVSPSDHDYFSLLHKNPVFLTSFHGFEGITSKTGRGDYFLFHGNLSVNENREAALFLIDKVFNDSRQKLMIAGKNPGKGLLRKAASLPNVSVVANPEAKEMASLITNAQACVLPTFQPTGLKLKLLLSLFSGRFCITNPVMAMNTGLENLCIIAKNPAEFKEAVEKTAQADFTSSEIEKRKLILKAGFSNKKKAEIIVRFLMDNK